MEQSSQTEIDRNYTLLESQIRECFGRVVYSHKTHEKCADISLSRHNLIKIIQIVLSAIVTTSLLIKIFGDQQWALMIGVALSTILFGINTYIKDFDLGEISQKHSNSASELWNILESYLSLITDIKMRSIKIEEAVQIRDSLQGKLVSVYTGSPRTISRAYKMASTALKINEELTFTDEELNKFLPEALRK
ncbi:MAG: SLATT domain-containing protein [Bacillota bacterium]|jgi:hypothetical protein